MWQIPAIVGGALVGAAAKAAVTVKIVVGTAAFLVVPIVITQLNYNTVEERARTSSPGKAVTVRREKDRDYIRIVLEASGEPAVWLTKKVDDALAKLLPHDGSTAPV